MTGAVVGGGVEESRRPGPGRASDGARTIRRRPRGSSPPATPLKFHGPPMAQQPSPRALTFMPERPRVRVKVAVMSISLLEPGYSRRRARSFRSQAIRDRASERGPPREICRGPRALAHYGCCFRSFASSRRSASSEARWASVPASCAARSPAARVPSADLGAGSAGPSRSGQSTPHGLALLPSIAGGASAGTAGGRWCQRRRVRSCTFSAPGSGCPSAGTRAVERRAHRGFVALLPHHRMSQQVAEQAQTLVSRLAAFSRAHRATCSSIETVSIWPDGSKRPPTLESPNGCERNSPDRRSANRVSVSNRPCRPIPARLPRGAGAVVRLRHQPVVNHTPQTDVARVMAAAVAERVSMVVLETTPAAADAAPRIAVAALPAIASIDRTPDLGRDMPRRRLVGLWRLLRSPALGARTPAASESPRLESFELLRDRLLDDGGQIAPGCRIAHQLLEPFELVAQPCAGGELNLVAAGRRRFDAGWRRPEELVTCGS